LIAETGLSQTEFSRRHGINRGTISQWVIQTNLRFRPHFKVRLARALGMTTAAFDEALMQARSD
jgi:transcriptional regulator with XRE-family HTH domain